ncbi:MAG: choice-of-anchor J domain-containing protein [Candidatus Syntrophosphaera sp.]|nr:choice-of-anchor J domain-containing protein [Candidatus Syntrophosphaera sp.]
MRTIACIFILTALLGFAHASEHTAIVNLSRDPVTVFPYQIGFDGPAFPPDGWTNVHTAGQGEPGTWDRQTAGTNPDCLPQSGAGMARYNSAELLIGNRAELISPPLAVAENTVYQASFWIYRNAAYPNNYDFIKLYLNDSPTSVGGEILLNVFRHYTLPPEEVVPNQWYEYTVFFGAETFSSPLYLVFEAYSGNGTSTGSNLYLDEISIGLAVQPSITLNLSNWNFGNVMLGQAATQQFTLSNQGTGPGMVFSLNASGTGFSISDDPTPVLLLPGGSVSFTIQFAPVYYRAEFGFAVYTYEYGYSGQTAEADVQLTGTGYFPAINTFPWSEDFEGGVFPPPGWTYYDMDGVGTSWEASTAQNHTPGGTTSALHAASDEAPEIDGGQRGWLVSPPISMPSMGNSILALSFWSLNVNPANYQSNSIWVSTGSPDPQIGPYQQFESVEYVADEWINNQYFTLWLYEYQTIHIAFRYGGYAADDWYLDDVSVFAPDLLAPEITHLPLINSPRDDIAYRVWAEIEDDPEFNNPIADARISYSVNGGGFTDIVMANAGGNSFYADIPPQPLNSSLEYLIQASDDQNNIMARGPWFFTVEDPVWLRYDSGYVTNYLQSYASWGAANYFENPFYGTDVPLAVHAVDGNVIYPEPATLKIYSFNQMTNMQLLFSQQVYLQGTTTIDLSSYNLSVNDQYLLVGFFDLAPGGNFGINEEYNYGRSLQYFGDQYQPLDMGAWGIGAQVGAGTLTLEAPLVSIQVNSSGNLILSWNQVPGANSYRIYASADPFAPEPWELFWITDQTMFVYTWDETAWFFKVAANSSTPRRDEAWLIDLFPKPASSRKEEAPGF